MGVRRKVFFPALARSVDVWRKRDARATPWLRGLTSDALSSTRWTTFILTPAPAQEVKFAMGLMRHGKVPPLVSHSGHEVRFGAAATLSE
jgi:hypothetical protein